MIYFISYDISSPKRLRMAAKKLSNFGIRVQYSFFECEMSEEQKDTVVDALLKIIDLKEDSLAVYPVCTDCLSLVRSLGAGELYKPSTYVII